MSVTALIPQVKLLQLSVHVLLPPQCFEVDEAAILFLSFSVMEEKIFFNQSNPFRLPPGFKNKQPQLKFG